ncbi:MAG: hypothetical protein GX568_08985 [Candidatus Gastranaerophilales bacterium]|nr:hypothetical protein [Candidatus Gastranaerophilales bacterium]
MIRAVGQNFNTTTYKAKNNNQKPAFGNGKKSLLGKLFGSRPASKSSGKWDDFMKSCKDWDSRNAKWANGNNKKAQNKKSILA